jgi:hypothetical protein
MNKQTQHAGAKSGHNSLKVTILSPYQIISSNSASCDGEISRRCHRNCMAVAIVPLCTVTPSRLHSCVEIALENANLLHRQAKLSLYLVR